MIQRRHADIFLNLARQADAELDGPDRVQWLERLDREHDQFRTALRYSTTRGDPETALRLASALSRFWALRGYLDEGLQWLETALAEGGEAPPHLHARALNAAATLAKAKSELTRADAYYQRSLEITRQLKDPHGVAVILDNLAALALERDDYSTARSLYKECLAIMRSLEANVEVAAVLNNLAAVLSHEGEYADARAQYEEALELFRALEDDRGVATTIVNIAIALARSQQEYEQAMEMATEGLDLFGRLGARQEIADCLRELADVAQKQGKLGDAARLLGTVQALHELIGAQPPDQRQALDQHVAQIRAGLDEASFSQAWIEGRETALKLANAYHWAARESETETETATT